MASAERTSEHPLGEAIVRGAKDRGLPLAEAATFEAVSGGGIRASVEGGKYSSAAGASSRRRASPRTVCSGG